MSKFSQLLGRLEEQAINIHVIEQERVRERTIAHRAITECCNEKMHLQQEVTRLSQPRDPESKKAHAYDELHRVILDAHSLFDDDSLTDADRAKSIHGLIDQVLGRDWFADSPHHVGAAPSRAKRTPRKTKTPPLVLSDIPIERDATDEDAPEYVTPDGKFDAEAADEDAREFARDY
jgi:hypothetical protein